MKFSFKNLFKREQAEEPAKTLLSTLIEAKHRGGEVHSDREAMAVPTVARCLQVLTEGVANLEMRYMRMQDGIYQDYEESPFHYMLKVQPNATMSAYTFFSQIVQQMYHHTGNAYVFPRYTSQGDLYPEELILLNPYCVVHDVMNEIYFISDVENGVYGTFKESEILHFFRFTVDGKQGMSVLEYAKRTMSIAATGDTETLDRFRNGGNVRGLLTNNRGVKGFGEYQDKELREAAQDLEYLFRNGTQLGILPGQSDFINFGMTSTDMQFLESRKFSVQEIARVYGVPLYMLFFDSSSNYKSADMTQKAFTENTLYPLLRRIENEFNRKLVSRQMCCKRKFCYNLDSMMAADLLTRADYMIKLVQSGVYTVNDLRKKENQPTVEGGDRVLVSTNLAPLDSAKLTGEAKGNP